MNLEKPLGQYADLLVRFALNLKAGEKLQITCDEFGLPLARLVAEKAFKAGALDVLLDFTDGLIARSRYLYAPDSAFDSYPAYRAVYQEQMYQDDYHVLRLATPDPELFRDVDQERMVRWQRVSGQAIRHLKAYQMENRIKWCIAAAASPAWAQAVFPELSPEEAIEKLWQSVFCAVRVDQADPVAAWEAHDRMLKTKQERLNAERLMSLRYEAPGTDFTIGLVDGHTWIGGSSVSQTGDRFEANVPTEEVFTMPHADTASGTLRVTKATYHNGCLIDGASLTFREGRVVDFSAREGEDALASLINMDEGAGRLGEVALVPDDSPISQMGILFKTTLFDENASCHFALGNAYAENLPGSKLRSDEENRRLGKNSSIIHMDFMVGGPELRVTGIRADGSEQVIMERGLWRI